MRCINVHLPQQPLVIFHMHKNYNLTSSSLHILCATAPTTHLCTCTSNVYSATTAQMEYTHSIFYKLTALNVLFSNRTNASSYTREMWNARNDVWIDKLYLLIVYPLYVIYPWMYVLGADDKIGENGSIMLWQGSWQIRVCVIGVGHDGFRTRTVRTYTAYRKVGTYCWMSLPT